MHLAKNGLNPHFALYVTLGCNENLKIKPKKAQSSDSFFSLFIYILTTFRQFPGVEMYIYNQIGTKIFLSVKNHLFQL